MAYFLKKQFGILSELPKMLLESLLFNMIYLFNPLSAIVHYTVHGNLTLFIVLYLGALQFMLPCVTLCLLITESPKQVKSRQLKNLYVALRLVLLEFQKHRISREINERV